MVDSPRTEALMTDRGSPADAGTITVLHVDDDPDFVAMVAQFLERANENMEVVTETSVADAFDRLRTLDSIDCIVSDYRMPEVNGIEFLEAVREDDPHRPFILFTGEGSEAVASKAVSAGATEYMQKGSGTKQYEILANRIATVVEGYRHRSASAERGRRLETLISNLPGAVYQCENEPGWPINAVGGECEELTGYTAEAIERGAVSFGTDIIHPDDREPVRSAVQDAVDANEPFEVTYRILTANDGVTWVWERGRGLYTADGEITALEGFITDISDRKDGGGELQREPGRLRALFDSTSDSVVYCEFDGDDPIILDVNAAFEATFGFDAGSVVGERFEEIIVPPEARDEARNITRQVKAGTYIEAELHCQTANGVRLFNHRAVPIVTDGDTTKTYAIFTDITEREQDERQIRRLEHFAGRLSHDLRNPLAVAKGRLDAYHDAGDEIHYETATKALARMDSLISDILTLAQTGERISLSEYETVGLATVAENAWTLVRDGDATLTVDGEASIDADASRLQQVLENLFRNAIEHCGDDVSVRVGPLPDERGFYVADDGPGIPPAHRDDVFEPEFTTKQDGTGFGLATIARIVDAHGWGVRVTESREGGTRFEVYDIEGFVDA